MEVATEFKSSKKPSKPKKASGEAIKRVVKRAKKAMEEFDRTKHNRNIAKLRGTEWRNNLRWSKIGENLTPINIARLDKGLSQRDMVRKTTVGTQVTYGRIERGERKATKKNAQSIAKALGVKVLDIFKPVDKNHYIII